MSAPTKVVVLELDGDCRVEPVRVRLTLGNEGERLTVQQRGELPPCPELIEALERWRDLYRHLGQLNRALKPQEILYEGRIWSKPEECRAATTELTEKFRAWLSATSFRKIDEQLREEFSRDESIQVSICTTHHDLQRLPWHQWRFVERYPHAEVGLSAPVAELPPSPSPSLGQKVRILAILGHSDGIDIETDRRLLKAIPDADVCFLPTPDRQSLSQVLWDQPWDILFFAGHSETDNAQGRIHLNPDESLTLDELKHSLRAAISHGLRLAIFNSCDGLGLAYELEQLNIPQMIVMREPVPDQVAQAFLKGFLQAFSQGRSLYEAVREARERLEGIEGDFPCASWLPVIYDNPVTPSLNWHSPEILPQNKLVIQWSALFKVVLIAFMVTSLVLGMRSQGWLQASELKTYDRLVQLRPKVPADERLLIITVDEEDIAYQDQHHMERRAGWSLSDGALAQVFQNTSNQARVIGLDIYHPYAFEPKLADLIKSTPSAFVGICEMDSPYSTPDSMTPPPILNEEQIGFSDLVADPDGVIRRHLISMTAGENCQTSHAFSLQIVEQYLQSAGLMPIKRLSDGRQQIHNFILKRFEHNSGGYQLPPVDANGYQVLLNYRYSPPHTVPLRELLEQSTGWSLDEDSIVLLGVKQAWQDQHLTPLKFGRIPGVEVHAHMISQLLDAALKNRGILWWLPKWQESLWIFFWALLAGIWAVSVKSPLHIGLGSAVIIGSLFTICWLLLLIDGWVPLMPALLGIMGTPVALIIRDRVCQRIGI